VSGVLAQQAFGQVGESPNVTGRITNAAELAQFAMAGYNGGDFGPVSVAPARLTEHGQTRDVFLVGLSGTEPVAGQSTGWGTNLRVGLNRDNDGLRNAREALLQLPEGSRLVLTGHSQGGMIAQQLAADPAIRRRFEVLHTVTFGSPPIAVGAREGQTRRLVAVGDPVALASPLGPLAALGRRGTDTAQTAFLNPIDTHRFAYTDETRDLGQRDALGRPAGTARLEFEPAARRMVSSPTR
jgi:pimeloyl-ACP methyl ester carboxylesterase